MFNKSDIFPRRSQAKKYLMKELVRRHFLNGGPVMKLKKWDVKRIVHKPKVLRPMTTTLSTP